MNKAGSSIQLLGIRCALCSTGVASCARHAAQGFSFVIMGLLIEDCLLGLSLMYQASIGLHQSTCINTGSLTSASVSKQVEQQRDGLALEPSACRKRKSSSIVDCLIARLPMTVVLTGSFIFKRLTTNAADGTPCKKAAETKRRVELLEANTSICACKKACDRHLRQALLLHRLNFGAHDTSPTLLLSAGCWGSS